MRLRIIVKAIMRLDPLAVVQNCHHYQEHTQSILFCDPHPSLQKEYFENIDFGTPWTINDIFKKHTLHLDPLPPMCMLMKIMALLDNSLPKSMDINALASDLEE